MFGGLTKLWAIVILVSFVFFAPSTGKGQTTFGSIVGTVADSSGGIIPDAQVTLTNVGTSETRASTTGPDGLYSFVNLIPGTYRIDAEKTGFKHVTRERVVVEVQNAVRIDLTLEVGAVTQTIEVNAQTPLLQPETSDLGQVIEQRKVNELPLNGRNSMNLVALAPSVVPQGQSEGTPVGTNNYGWGNYQMGGAITNQASVYLDGVPLNNSYLNALSMIPSQDSLQEFKVQTNNLSAEWGRFAGGVVNFTTKTGSNDIHGTAYEYLRNKVLNANTFYNNAASPVIATPPFTQNQFGVDAGGPFVIPHLYDGRNKTFWFASYEGFRLRQGQTFALTEPTPSELAGNLTPLGVNIYDPTTTTLNPDGTYSRQPISCNGQLNVICPQNINPTAAVMAKEFPAPNSAGLPVSGLFNYVTDASVGGDTNAFTIRGDQNVSSKQRLFARYTYWKLTNLPIDPLKNGVCDDRCFENYETHNAVLDDVYTFSPTTILDLALTFNRWVYDRRPITEGYNLSQYGPDWGAYARTALFTTIAAPCLQAPFSDVWCSQGDGAFIASRSDDLRAAGSLTKIAGKHTLKFGGEIRQDTVNSGHTNEPVGLFNFTSSFTSTDPINQIGGSSLASFLLGYGSSVTQSTTTLAADSQWYPALYLQDVFRATHKLTLDLGFRWESTGPFVERHNRMTVELPNAPSLLPALPCVTVPTATATALGSGQVCLGSLKGDLGLVDSPERPERSATNTPWHQFSPRVGFAYQLDPKTVLRGGYGLFWISNDVEYSTESDIDLINSIATPWVTSADGGKTPCVTPSPTGCVGGPTFNLSNPFPSGLTPAPGRNAAVYEPLTYANYFTAALPNNPYAYYQQWNFDVQRELPEGTLMDLAYAGSKGTHLPDYAQSLNNLPDRYLSLGSHLSDTVPNPFYNIVTNGSFLSFPTTSLRQLLLPYPQYGDNEVSAAGLGGSTYNSLQLKVEKRMKAGASLLVSYTISKMITTADVDSLTSWLEAGSGPGGIQDWNNLKAERSICSYDVPQRLVAAYVLDLPVGHGRKYLSGTSEPVDKLIGGWGIQGVTIYQRGFPLVFGYPIGSVIATRPDKTATGALNGSPESRLNEWFNPAAFSLPAAYTWGNESRTDPVLRSDGIENWDFAMVKNTTFGPDDKLGMQFRAEFFNLFNTPQFGPPGTTQGASNFGVVSSQLNNPRLIQFALRFTF